MQKQIKYRYFKSEFDGDINIYRIPDNGKSLVNNMSLIEKYIGNDKWSSEDKYTKGVVEDYMTGYFDSEQDEINVDELLKIINYKKII